VQRDIITYKAALRATVLRCRLSLPDLMFDDLPKWQANMLQKREKATRAGKEKLSKRIDKQIATIQQNAAPAPIG